MHFVITANIFINDTHLKEKVTFKVKRIDKCFFK